MRVTVTARSNNSNVRGWDLLKSLDRHAEKLFGRRLDWAGTEEEIFGNGYVDKEYKARVDFPPSVFFRLGSMLNSAEPSFDSLMKVYEEQVKKSIQGGDWEDIEVSWDMNDKSPLYLGYKPPT